MSELSKDDDTPRRDFERDIYKREEAMSTAPVSGPTNATLVERLRELQVGERLEYPDLRKKLQTAEAELKTARELLSEFAEALYGSWITPRAGDELYGCAHCTIEFDDPGAWEKRVHDSDCIVNKAAAMLAAAVGM